MSTYAAMRATFLGLLNRTDCKDPDAALVKGWFDNSITRIQREVRAPIMERELEIDTTSDVSQVTIPNDYLETKAWVWETDAESGEITSLELGVFYEKKRNVIFSLPQHYCRQRNKWNVIGPIPAGATSTVIYYGELDPLVNDLDEPTLARVASDLIVYGALTYAADYFSDDRGTTWENKWQFFREQIQSQSSEGDNETGSNTVQPAIEYDDHV